MSILHLSNPAYARHQGWDDNVTGPLGKILRELEEVVNEVQCENVALPGDRGETSDLIDSMREGLRDLERALALLDDADPDEQPEEEV